MIILVLAERAVRRMADRMAFSRTLKPTCLSRWSVHRYLQYRIGRDYHWVSRLRLNDAELGKILHDDATSISVLYLNGAPAGFFELSNKDPEIVSLEYFGTMQEAQGLGLGRWFLLQAIEAAWNLNPLKVTVNTCTLDHPAPCPFTRSSASYPSTRRTRSFIRCPTTTSCALLAAIEAASAATKRT